MTDPTPPAPVTPLTESEVMPDTSGSRSISGDNATPQASMLAPGADALDVNFIADKAFNASKLRGVCHNLDDRYKEPILEVARWIDGLTRASGGKP